MSNSSTQDLSKLKVFKDSSSDDSTCSCSILFLKGDIDLDKVSRGSRTVSIEDSDFSDIDDDSFAAFSDGKTSFRGPRTISIVNFKDSNDSIINHGDEDNISFKRSSQLLLRTSNDSTSSSVQSSRGGQKLLRRSASSFLSSKFYEMAKQQQEEYQQKKKKTTNNDLPTPITEKTKKYLIAQNMKALEHAHKEKISQLKLKFKERGESMQAMYTDSTKNQIEATKSKSDSGTPFSTSLSSTQTHTQTQTIKRPLRLVSISSSAVNNKKRRHGNYSSSDEGCAIVSDLITRMSSSNLLRTTSPSSKNPSRTSQTFDGDNSNANFDYIH